MLSSITGPLASITQNYEVATSSEMKHQLSLKSSDQILYASFVHVVQRCAILYETKPPKIGALRVRYE